MWESMRAAAVGRDMLGVWGGKGGQGGKGGKGGKKGIIN